jgi:hypothetical protein
MGFAWSRRGLLIPAPTPQPWAGSHAALPFADAIDDGQIAVYYSPRDEHGRGHVARARITADPAGELVLSAHEAEPILSPGPLGAFDDKGVTISCVVRDEEASFLYYTGWTLGMSVPFYFFVGLAVRRAGEQAYERVSPAPILERSSVDPYLTASPWVLHDNGSWRMWYVSATGWRIVGGAPQHLYHLRYAESEDGIVWRREGRVSIDFAGDDEYAISRPCVVRDSDCYRMWFSARGDRYRLGYAESPDGLTWIRDDRQAGLQPSAEGWDAEMLAYPAILDHGDHRYLLYNGNGYGRTGIGYAIGTATS